MISFHNSTTQDNQKCSAVIQPDENLAAPLPREVREAILGTLAGGVAFAEAAENLRRLLEEVGTDEALAELIGSGLVSEEVVLWLNHSLPGIVWALPCFLEPILCSLKADDTRRVRRLAKCKS